MTEHNKDDGDDPLEEVFKEAKEKSEEYKKDRSELMKAKDQLREKLEGLHSSGDISEEVYKDALNYVERGDYEKAREIVRENDPVLEFEDEEKQVFADSFSEEFEDVVGLVEQIRNELSALTDADRDKLVPYLHGRNVALKGELRDFFDTLDDLEQMSYSEMVSRLVSSKRSSLNLTTTREIMDEVRKEADVGGDQ